MKFYADLGTAHCGCVSGRKKWGSFRSEIGERTFSPLENSHIMVRKLTEMCQLFSSLAVFIHEKFGQLHEWSFPFSISRTRRSCGMASLSIFPLAFMYIFTFAYCVGGKYVFSSC